MPNSELTPDQQETKNAGEPEYSATLRHYLLGEQLGEGGFGQVFQAWDSKLERYVAVKRLKSGEHRSQSRQALHEARAAASLDHPAFVKIYAIEDEEDPPSIVMELIRGKTLRKILQDGPLSEADAQDMLMQLTAAMQVAHASGLIHGDLKPSNIMLDDNGRYRILDFGLALVNDTEVTTSTNQLDPQGTIAYMAPERLMGGALTASADIYALGVIFYEALTGHRPFPERNGLALAAALMQTPSDGWNYPAEIARPLVRFILQMTARAPDRRIASMQAVQQALTVTTDTSAATVPAGKEALLNQEENTSRIQVFPVRPALTRRILAVLAVVLGLSATLWAGNHYLNNAGLFERFSESRAMETGLQALQYNDRPGSLKSAEEAFQSVLAHDPNHAAAAAGLSIVNSYRFWFEFSDELYLKKAEASALQAEKLNSSLALSQVAMGLFHYLRHDYDLSLQYYDKAISLDPGTYFAWTLKIATLNALKRHDESLQIATEQLRLHPKQRLFADAIGEIHFQRGELKAAEKAFRASLEIDPDVVFAYINLSNVLIRQNRIAEAQQILQKGLQIRSSPGLFTNLGNLLFLQGNYVAAADAFRNAVSVDKGDPGDYLGWANLADTLLWLPGERDAAQQAYSRARELLKKRMERKPGRYDLISRLALYSARLKLEAEAIPLIEESLKLAPKQADNLFRAGLAYELLGKRALAIQTLHQAIVSGYPKQFIEAEPDLLELRRDPAFGS